MIVTDTVWINEREYYHTYSDRGMQIQQEETGYVYTQAYDVIPRAYTETEQPIPVREESAEEQVRRLTAERDAAVLAYAKLDTQSFTGGETE